MFVAREYASNDLYSAYLREVQANRTRPGWITWVEFQALARTNRKSRIRYPKRRTRQAGEGR